MEVNNQVCNLELAKRLKELGVNQDSLWWWCWFNDEKPYVSCANISDKKYSAFTVAELGELLPFEIGFVYEGEHLGQTWDYWAAGDLKIYKKKDIWVVKYDSGSKADIEFKEINEVDARAKMLIWVIEQKAKAYKS